MRGKVLQCLFIACLYGITPAYAGKSGYSVSGRTRHQDHPRLCGEKFRVGEAYSRAYRITPAYAGKRC